MSNEETIWVIYKPIHTSSSPNPPEHFISQGRPEKANRLPERRGEAREAQISCRQVFLPPSQAWKGLVSITVSPGTIPTMTEPHHVNLSSPKYPTMRESWQCELFIAKYVKLRILEHEQIAILINGSDRLS